MNSWYEFWINQVVTTIDHRPETWRELAVALLMRL
jgi:hypothetical protein